MAVRVFHGISFFDTHISARHSRALNGAHLPNLGEAAYTYLGRRELSVGHLPSKKAEPCSSTPTAKRLRTQSGRTQPPPSRVALNSDFISTRRDERLDRPAPRASSCPAVSWTGVVHVRARSRQLPTASFSHPANRPRHGLTCHRSRRMRSRQRAAGVLPGNSAKADRPFFPDRSCSLWRHLPPVHRCADGARSGPP